jgi:hypothetical protein
MARASLSGPRGELVIEREMIPVHYMSDIDAGWRYTDANGHRHYCDYEAADHYPTLREVTDETWWCADCADEHEDSHLECRQCGEVIRPGTTGPGTRLIAGPVTYTLNGEPVTEEQARELISGWGNDPWT